MYYLELLVTGALFFSSVLGEFLYKFGIKLKPPFFYSFQAISWAHTCSLSLQEYWEARRGQSLPLLPKQAGKVSSISSCGLWLYCDITVADCSPERWRLVYLRWFHSSRLIWTLPVSQGSSEGGLYHSFNTKLGSFSRRCFSGLNPAGWAGLTCVPS